MHRYVSAPRVFNRSLSYQERKTKQRMADDHDELPGDSSQPPIKFSSPVDKVTSEVNPFLVTSNGIKPLQKDTNLIARVAFSLPVNHRDHLSRTVEFPLQQQQPEVDGDGDLVLPRRNDDIELHIYIEYENSTTLDLVGLQIWRGAFLLSDFLLHWGPTILKGKRVLELGAGTGLVGIVASLFASHVTLTDLETPTIMSLLKANVAHNSCSKNTCCLPLNFMNAENCSNELHEAVSAAEVIIAADVIYHTEITIAFVRTLKRILLTGNKEKRIFVALEKRYVFTMSDLDAVAPMHIHFLEEMDNQLGLVPGCLPKTLSLSPESGTVKISMREVPMDELPQYFNYDRCKELVLYEIRSSA